jgi:adenylate cyclase
MPLEIERKFLVLDGSWRQAADEGIRMRQGYLSRNDKNSVRVRVAGDAAHINIKSATPGCVRREYEYPIPANEAEELLAGLCIDEIVEKTRYHVPVGEFVFEIDVFAGANRGLIVAEIELTDLDQEFPRPAWLGREVSDEIRFYNSELAAYPYRDWRPEEKEIPE